MANREEWFTLIAEQESAVDLFLDYYTETEFSELLLEFQMHQSQFREVFYHLLANAVFDVGVEDGGFEPDEQERVQLRIQGLKRCCDTLLPGVNDFEVEVRTGFWLHVVRSAPDLPLQSPAPALCFDPESVALRHDHKPPGAPTS